MAFKTLSVAVLLALQAHAQSVNPGVGANPKAEGSTEEVTPDSGPNG